MLISVGRSSAFFLLATKTAPRAASVQGVFASSGCGVGLGLFFGGFFFCHVRFSYSAPGLPVRHRAQLREYVAWHSSAVPGLNSQQRVWDSTWIDPSPIQRKLTSPLGSVGRRCSPVSREGNGQRGI
ncbi:hypothetical protein PoB_004939000 [Plakobranchus ocellatus]|uniref:Secreted protein n=1 Tax=Plakobranchus ocellatus TaxID=259542 RepID=A0AAV4BQL2_9GAST|nr:hypothetical protein PoB_004939000 [Plakobranchus ocellatus]